MATDTQPTDLGVSYVTVAASQTAQRISTKRGTFIQRLVIVPATTTPGVVTLTDGTGTGLATILAFPGGASSVADLAPITVELGFTCAAAAATVGWHITTGANVSVIAVVQVN